MSRADSAANTGSVTEYTYVHLTDSIPSRPPARLSGRSLHLCRRTCSYLLHEQDVDIDALVEMLNHLDEHEPTDEQLAIRQDHMEARKAVTGASSPLKQRVRAIETTVRARFGFSRRYDGGVPDPHPDYQDLDPTALKRELESARDELEQTEQRKDDLRQEIADDEARWIEKMQEELFD